MLYYTAVICTSIFNNCRGMLSIYASLYILCNHDNCRNDPAISSTGADAHGGASGLSPWIHFGMLSAQRCLLEVKRLKHLRTNRALFPEGDRTTGVHAFCEELVVRRELADNFCNFNEKYDQIEGAHK